MKQMTCPQCGAPLERDGHCAYCGTWYKQDPTCDPYSPIVFKTVSLPIRTLQVATRYRSEFEEQDPERAANYVAYDMTHKLAQSLADFIKITRNVDPYLQEVLVRGTVRVVEPDYRF